MDTQVITAWGIKSFDLIILRGRHYLVPFGSEIGFCINFM